MRIVVLALALAGMACGGKVAPSESEPDDGRAGETGVGVDVTIDTFVAPDVSPVDTSLPPEPVDSMPPPEDVSKLPAYDCFKDVGPNLSDTFISTNYTDDECTPPTGSCPRRSFRMDVRCVMMLDRKDTTFGAVAEEADCLALKRWLTSKILLDALEEPLPCGSLDAPFEQIIVSRFGKTRSRLANFCNEEPFVSHRACMSKIREKYFPVKK